jgi:hypothetical protein
VGKTLLVQIAAQRLGRETQRDARRFAEGLRSLLPPRRLPRARSGSLDRRRLRAHACDDRLFRAPGGRGPRLTPIIELPLRRGRPDADADPRHGGHAPAPRGLAASGRAG